jgi:dienelactone hydrolase
MSKHPIAEQRLVVRAPGTDNVLVARNVPLGDDRTIGLRMDLYRPAGAPDARLPAVVFVTGYSDTGSEKVLGCRLKDMASYVDWGRLVASAGMTAITYENEDPFRDANVLLRHIRDNAARLRVDEARIALWSCSGNVPTALALLQENRAHEERGIRCAALCYGYMLDGEGRDDVARAAQRWGFVVPNTPPALDSLARVPMLVVRAGRDDMPGLNESIDRFVAEALRANLPVTVVNQCTGPHGFDIFDATHDSRRAIRQIVGFLSMHLLE